MIGNNQNNRQINLLPLQLFLQNIDLIPDNPQDYNNFLQNYMAYNDCLQGVWKYLQYPMHNKPKDIAPLWQKGNTQIIHYPAINPTARIILIPSLINNTRILDLQKNSFCSNLANMGYEVFLMNWGEPDYHSKYYSTASYVGDRLLEAAEFIGNYQYQNGIKGIIAGYCLGGVMATALAHHIEADGLLLFSQPWDFLSLIPQKWRFMLEGENKKQLLEFIHKNPTFPASFLQMIFAMNNTEKFRKKFQKFNQMNDDEKIHNFIEIEDWNQSTLNIPCQVAEECLLKWPSENSLLNSKWKVAGKVINPENIKCKTLSINPQKDMIVPYDSSHAFVNNLANGQEYRPDCGHIGIFARNDLQKQAIEKIDAWIKSL